MICGLISLVTIPVISGATDSPLHSPKDKQIDEFHKFGHL